MLNSCTVYTMKFNILRAQTSVVEKQALTWSSDKWMILCPESVDLLQKFVQHNQTQKPSESLQLDLMIPHDNVHMHVRIQGSRIPDPTELGKSSVFAHHKTKKTLQK